ncbi:MAG TPA: DNA helicase II [Sulfurivirga caldicuralii]|nr:DNA helicase II [Sulfurivirga caldicuralii]
MDISFLLNALNDAQREAVTLPEDTHALVLAGAGSGKTRVLTHRLGWLTEALGMAPWNLLAVTFTNKAAAEMRARVHQLVGAKAEQMTLGTFHGIAYRLLRQHWREAGLMEMFQVIDSDDQKRLIKRLLREMGLDEAQWPVRQVAGFINSNKEAGRRAAHIDPGQNPYVDTLLRVYRAYEQQCAARGLVDFAELLLRAHELWLKNPQLLAHYQSRYRHILVDEFQDTNSLQYAWLRVLAGGSGRLFVVGDDDQSIYGWRGAQVENIQRFSEDFAGVRIIRLEQNYRSTATILKAANTLIAHNSGRMGKNLWTDGDQGDPIRLYRAFNELEEADFVCRQVESWLEAGGSRSEIAVLYRSNAQSRVLEQALLRHGIPYRVYGGLRFYERAEIKDVLAYLRLLLNRDDDASFDRVINQPPRGIGARTLEQIRAQAMQQDVSLWQAAQQLVDTGALAARARTAVAGFLALIDQLSSACRDLPLEQQVMTVISRSGLQAQLEKSKSEQAQSKIENLDELISAAAQFRPDGEPDDAPPLQAFLNQAALEAGEHQAEPWESCVQLMTLHSAKGLEFPFVMMVGMEEGLFPSQQSLEDPARLEEERRLCYVGITRAQKKLVMSWCEQRRWHGKTLYPMPSRFLRELPPDCVEEMRPKASVSPAWRQDRALYEESAAFASRQGDGLKHFAAPSFRIGDRVRHARFGEGIVIGLEGGGEQARIQVHFDAEGSKWLLLSLAKLERA